MISARVAPLALPQQLRIEASSACQLRCPSCPTTTGATRAALGTGFLKLADFTRLLDENPSLKRIELSSYGEAFLNPQFLGILELAQRKKIELTLDNGANLNNVRDAVLEGIVAYGLRVLRCSIDGASPETYRVYRVRGDFDRVIANIRKINEYKQLYKSPWPELRWQFVVFGHNQHELPKARALAAELGMEFFAKLSWDDEVSPLRDANSVRAELGKSAATREEYREIHGEDYTEHICDQLWHDPQINWDGKVLGCCRNFWGDFGGNVFTDGLARALDHDKMRHARAMLEGRAAPRADIPCSDCDLYRWRASTGRWVGRKPPLPQRIAARWRKEMRRLREMTRVRPGA